MKAVIIGLVILGAAVFAILPQSTLGAGLGWGDDVLAFLRGGAPVASILIGLIAIFIGIADMKDRADARKEAKAEAQKEDAQ